MEGHHAFNLQWVDIYKFVEEENAGIVDENIDLKRPFGSEGIDRLCGVISGQVDAEGINLDTIAVSQKVSCFLELFLLIGNKQKIGIPLLGKKCSIPQPDSAACSSNKRCQSSFGISG